MTGRAFAVCTMMVFRRRKTGGRFGRRLGWKKFGEQRWASVFLQSIEKKRKPVADIEPSHRSSVLPMLGMISYKLGRSIEWDGGKEKISEDKEANKLLRRDYRNPWVYPKV